MALVRGITVLDLIAALPPGLQGFIPADIAEFIELLSIVDHRTHTSGRFYIHHGRVQSAVDAGLNLPSGFPLIIPGLTRGVVFQFAHDRSVLGAGDNVEPVESTWVLDLFLDQVGIPLPFVKPARRVDSGPAKPGYLVRDATRSNVQLIGSGVLRISGGSTGPRIALIAPPNPIAPTDPIGAVIEFNLAPRHMLLHDSGLGMTIDRVVWDDSTTYTPPEIEARNHDAEWRGLTIKEASVYLPRDLPLLGDVSLGVRDLILGFEPPGFQGEAALELGEALISNFQFFRDDGGTAVAVNPVQPSGRVRDIALGSVGATARVYARAPVDKPVVWKLPGVDRWLPGPQTPWFTVSPDSETAVLRVRERITQGSDSFYGPEHRFYFKRDADPDAPRPRPPRIDVTPAGGSAQANVTSLSGDAVSLAGALFTATAGTPAPTAAEQARWTWLLRHAGSESSGTGTSFSPTIAWQPGRHLLRLTDHRGQTRHLEIDVLPAGQLVLGCQNGVRDRDGAALTPTQVEGSYSLDSFHENGARAAAEDGASLDGGALTVPPGVLAELALELAGAGGGEASKPTTKPRTRHVRVLMEFDRTEPTYVREYQEIVEPAGTPEALSQGDAWGAKEPYPYRGDGKLAPGSEPTTTLPSWSSGALANWVAQFPPETQFVVIGRCCDRGSQAHNDRLARDRARRGRALLLGLPLKGTGVHVTDAQIYSRGEQTQTEAAGTFPTDDAQFPPAPAEAKLGERTKLEWRITEVYTDAQRQLFIGNDQPERKEYRGVDIFAVVPDAAAPAGATSDNDALGATRRRALVPGADTPQAVVVAPREPEVGYRLQVLAKWDSPTFIDARDAIPTMVQLTIDWETQALPLPITDGGNIIPQATSGEQPVVYQLIARLSYDPRSGDTVLSMALDTPGDDRGLFDIVHAFGEGDDATAARAFATALAIGPALLGGIEPANEAGTAVRIAALLSATAAAAAGLVEHGLVTLQRFEVEQRMHAGNDGTASKTKLVVDYTATLTIDSDFIQSAAPVKIRYKNVGVLIDNAETKLAGIQFIYEDVDFEIADPGRWTMNGVLGELLGVTEVRIGAGSVWFEVDLAFALDLGVVEVTKATVRLVIKDGAISFELRGLAANVEVPGVVKGGGQLKVGAAGDISAAIDLEIIPAEIKAWASLNYNKPMVHLEAGVRFATAIPLAATGLGIFGFVGRFVSNGKRIVADTGDPVQDELDWYRKAPVDKYGLELGQHALGLGAIVGTLPDAGFSFNAVGMLAVGFPDPSVVFGIDAKFIGKPDAQAKEEGDAPGGSSLTMLGLIAIDSDGLVVGVRGSYEIPKLLELKVPAGAYFPFGETSKHAFVRIGSDNVNGRNGEPVTITVLPGLLDQKCWAYLMVEEKILHDLGGQPDIDFDGFSIGFGAGWGFKWGGGPIYLRASAQLLVGLGTRPFVLMGQIRVEGELRLIIVTISVSGEITVRLADNGSYLRGKFCGKVSFLFFDVEGCVEFTVNGGAETAPPNPGPLVSSLSLADPYARVTAVGTTGSPGSANTAWPDTCPVLRFDHRVRVNLGQDGFQPDAGPPGASWSGSTRLKFLYELQSVRLLENGQPLSTEDWMSRWWLPTFRPGLPAPGEPLGGEHEGWELALLHWDLAPWSRNLPQGGEGLPADPADTIDQICKEPPPVLRNCVVGQVMTRLLSDTVRLAPFQNNPPPYPSNFRYTAVEGLYPNSLAHALTQAIDAGRQFDPGAVVPLPQPFGPPNDAVMKDAYRLPYTSKYGASFQSLSINGSFDEPIVQPEAWLGLYVKFPAPGAVVDRCVRFVGYKVGQAVPQPLMVDGVKFSDTSKLAAFVDVDPLGGPDGVPELRFPSKTGLRIELPAVTGHVAAYVGLVKPPAKFSEAYRVVLEAFDVQGVLIGTASTTETSGKLTRLEINAPGIYRLIVRQGAENGYLQRLCFHETTPQDVDYTQLAKQHFEKLQTLPVVHGVLPKGDVVAWPGQKFQLLLKNNEAVQVLHYKPSDHKGPYLGMRVLPYAQGARVLLLSVCAFTQKSLADHADDELAHADLADAIDDAATGAEEQRHRLLKANTEYTVEVRYRVAAWQPTDDQTVAKPPEVSSFDWAPSSAITIFDDQVNTFKFRTAAAGTLPDSQVLSPDVQSAFDPRSLARYLLGFDPATTQPSHFLGDELRVFFEVEWVPTLLERYGRELELRVQRTDPGPGAHEQLGVYQAVPLEPLTISWGSLPYELLPVADKRISDAIAEAPCLPKTPPQGATGAVTGPLEPDVDYDFIVSAVGIDAPGAAVVIGRSHLHTSRYHGPVELIEATGFTAPYPSTATPLDALLPADAILPGATALADDALLDAALGDLGLDPWPLPREPRTCLLWKQAGAGWALAGVLLDSDEAMVRPQRLGDSAARMTLVRCKIAIQNGTLELTPRRSNAAGTRVLFTPNNTSPLSLPAGDLTLALEFTDQGALKTHSRSLSAVPSIISKETQP